MFGEIGIEKLLLIFGIVLIIFGAKRMPEIGAGLGKGIREFKRATTGTLEDASRSAPEDEPRTTLEPQEVAPSRAATDDSPRRLIS